MNNKRYKLMTILFILCLNVLRAEAADSLFTKPGITFLELGSTTCVPCKMMEPVLESIREKYGQQINVVFYDVKKNKEIAQKYRIRMIPTQVFLDAEGNEIHRHVGFYPEEQIDAFLQNKGLKPAAAKGADE
jgi:thioredoxin 1